jgi:hypothetical protein
MGVSKMRPIVYVLLKEGRHISTEVIGAYNQREVAEDAMNAILRKHGGDLTKDDFKIFERVLV